MKPPGEGQHKVKSEHNIRSGKLNKGALLKELNLFYTNKEVKLLAKEHGLDDYLYNQANKFRMIGVCVWLRCIEVLIYVFVFGLGGFKF